MKATYQNANTQFNAEYFTKVLNLQNCPKNVSNWTEIENYAYLRFLSINSYKFECKKKKLKRRSLFSIMSDYIVTRSAQQCKSHHQKMIKFYGSIQGIIQRLRKSLHLDNVKTQTCDKNSITIQTQAQSSVQETPIVRQRQQQVFGQQIQQDNLWSFIDDQVWLNN